MKNKLFVYLLLIASAFFLVACGENAGSTGDGLFSGGGLPEGTEENFAYRYDNLCQGNCIDAEKAEIFCNKAIGATTEAKLFFNLEYNDPQANHLLKNGDIIDFGTKWENGVCKFSFNVEGMYEGSTARSFYYGNALEFISIEGNVYLQKMTRRY